MTETDKKKKALGKENQEEKEKKELGREFQGVTFL